MTHKYIGLISGTSMDGIDAVIVDYANNQCKTLDFATYPYPEDLLDELKTLCQPGDNEVNRLAMADRQVAACFASACQDLLTRNNLTASDIKLIGSHGQTIRHHPDGEFGYSVQIGDGNSIAVKTGIDVVADFRRKDIALGGQGAPLVPAFHQAVFSSPEEHRVVLNIGGIANISYLPKGCDPEQVLGFDTGPGNRLMDAWCHEHTGKEYDENGAWAASGQCHLPLLHALKNQDYFKQPAPKSTGRELFNLEWLEQSLTVQPEEIPAEDVQATLLELTALSIANDIKALQAVDSVYVCGGGAQNAHLMARIAAQLDGIKVTTTHELGIHPDAVEALAFAWLAWAFENNVQGNVPKVTGASRGAVLGTLFKHQ
ncbi:anhydro-N-acetylmuramic acid kinase [Planctobacterium marinum]|uniref:anhydro-N-acetylmuramic acid kinase n=1 Tax=Planctobacterium marinum TaxID=1631968 RepID=UPI001E46701E|nr:anhydro-N-acetylmuramic acid kinase [Planctobacterium marinum]MCC2605039.1 anhydro-N-acetylmuramic acid kinase [Planctobacterium marinum]